MNEENDNWKFWLKLIITLSILILIGIGFILGYLYDDKSCIEDPLTYGIKKINEVNSDDFTCICYSSLGNIKPFSFSKEGVEIEVSNPFDF